MHSPANRLGPWYNRSRLAVPVGSCCLLGRLHCFYCIILVQRASLFNPFEMEVVWSLKPCVPLYNNFLASVGINVNEIRWMMVLRYYVLARERM